MGPLKFTPLLKRIRWGGRRLGELLGKALGNESDYAESWEICDHGVDQSRVASGPFAGLTLQELVQQQGHQLFGPGCIETQFPLLIKFLDANDRLSVQVHPNDEQAHAFLPWERGKTEAWVILSADPGSCVYAGLKSGVTRESLMQALQAGSVEECLHKLPVAPGDCIFVPAGTVHAIGEGIVLAEVQQSSNLTFRLFDWNRLGQDGRPRQLHIEESLACIDFDRGPVELSQPMPVPDGSSSAERLVTCDYFTINRHRLTSPLDLPDEQRGRILMVLIGDTEVSAAGEALLVRRGETVLLPATAGSVRVVPHTTATILEVFW